MIYRKTINLYIMKIGIIGNGFVGKATKLLKCDAITILVYDIRAEACEPLGTTLDDMETCDLVFLCLPTPINHNGCCYTNILTDVVSKISNPYKVIRSTVPIGYSESVGCFFMPEFLTEANWKEDFITSKHWVFGLCNSLAINFEFKRRITKLFSLAMDAGSIESSEIVWMTNSEAEFLKLAKNCFLAAKVGIFNELYQLAKAKNIDYDMVKSVLRMDPRIGTTHMNVPGINGKFGYGGTCFPKDTHSLYNQFQANNVPSYYFQTSLVRNETVDRREREWAVDYWRTTIPTDKKISLIISDEIETDTINRLLNDDNIVILLTSNHTIENTIQNPNFLIKYADMTNKQFFPRLDNIYYLLDYKDSTYEDIKASSIKIFNLIDLLETHKCFLTIKRDLATNNILSKYQYNITIL